MHFCTRLKVVEAPSRIELEMAILQTAALPLGYGAILSKQRAYRSNMPFVLERETGLEPATSALARRRSTE